MAKVTKTTKKPVAKKPVKAMAKPAKPAAPAPTMRYTQEAVDKCRELYHKYGGRNYDAIENEMRREYPGWSKSRLLSKGIGENFREGWIEKFGFDRTLKLVQEVSIANVLNDSQALYLQIQTVRKAAGDRVVGKVASKDDHYIYRDYVKLELAAKAQLDLGRASFETTAEAWGKILEWCGELVEAGKMSAKTLKELVAGSDHMLDRARETYGESEGTEQPVDS